MNRSDSGLVLAFVLLPAALLISGCNVHKQGEGKNEKVDINTPVGSFHVSKQPDPKDVGVAIYPRAQQITATDDGSATVNLDSSMFGLHVVALKYKSEDSPAKVLEFYRKELRNFGDVSECQGDFSVTANKSGAQSSRCVPKGDKTELQAGTSERRHFVSVKPAGNGCEFELVYIQTRGEREPL